MKNKQIDQSIDWNGDLDGKQYFNLKIMGEMTYSYRGIEEKSGKYLCKCKCKKEILVPFDLLKTGTIKSCGCPIEIKVIKGGPGFYRGNGYKDIFRRYLQRALKKNLDFSLTEDYFYSLIFQPCHYCGRLPSNKISAGIGNKKVKGFYSGIDRIDSLQGYVPGNVVPCCGFCNRAKSNMKIEEFKQWIKNMYEQLMSYETVE